MPTRDTPWPNGTSCWVDIGVPDVEAAKAFYSDLLGWDYAGGGEEFGGYLNATLRGRTVAGIGPQQDPDDPPRWTTYFATDDSAAAKELYTAVFGFTFDQLSPEDGADMDHASFTAGGDPLGGWVPPARGCPRAG